MKIEETTEDGYLYHVKDKEQFHKDLQTVRDKHDPIIKRHKTRLKRLALTRGKQDPAYKKVLLAHSLASQNKQGDMDTVRAKHIITKAVFK